MVTMLEEYDTEEQHSVVHFLGAKGLSTEDIHKEMFLVYGGQCLLHKAIHNWIKKFSSWTFRSHRLLNVFAEWAETTVKNFCAAGFDTLVKRWEKGINV
jgi:hypothetical protein